MRPVTFFYNGGPGSSAVFLLLGSFAPRRIKTNMPGFTPPPPYTMEDNPDSLIDRSDLVYINPVGTGYSSAIAPFKNRDLGRRSGRALHQAVHQALSDRQWPLEFAEIPVRRIVRHRAHLVLAWMLHEDGIDLNGLTLQSSVLDYPANFSNAVGLMPTFAANAWYHNKTGLNPPPVSLPAFMDTVTQFSSGAYAKALAAYPHQDPMTVQTLSQYLGVPANVLIAWQFNVEAADRLGHSLFLITLLQDQGLALGAYDRRVTGIDTGIAAIVSPDGGMNDPTMAAVGGVYTAMWNTYLNTELLFTSTSNYVDLNDQAFQFWDFSHTDPTGAVQKPDAQGNPTLYTAGDLAATMAANLDLLALSANGYFNSVTPFYQTKLTLDAMPLQNAAARANLTIRNYPSGHMVYLDGNSRTALKADLATLYDGATHAVAARLTRMALIARTIRTRIHPYFILRKPGGAIRPAAVGAEPWEVADLCGAYSWPTGLAGGGVIAIVEFAGGWLQSDVDAYFARVNLPKPAIVDVPIGGAGNAPNPSGNPSTNPDGEVALDIQVAAAAYRVATGQPATIRIYWADASDWGSMATAISAAAADGCDVCSISWGTDEANWQAAGQATGIDFVGQLNGAAQAAAAVGMTVFAASGDNDSSDGGPTPANVDLPSSSPFVVGCGGTSKPHGGGEETVWNNDPGNSSRPLKKSLGSGIAVSGGSIAPTAGWRALDSLTSLSRERVRYVSDTELLHKSKGEPVRRLEIFTGSGRRRVWTSEQKAEILAESYESGDKVSAVARRHGLTPQQLFGWRRNAQRRVVRRRGASTAAGSVSFAQVMVEAPAPSAAASCAIPCATIEIALGAAVVRVSPGIDVATLTKVLRAVKAAT